MKNSEIRNIIFGISFVLLIRNNPSIVMYMPHFISVILFIRFARKIQQDKEYGILKKLLLITGYLAANIIFYVLLLSGSISFLLVLALLAISYQLYYKQKTPKHFRTLCFNISLAFLIYQIDFMSAAVLFSSSIFAYVFFSLMIAFVIIQNIEDNHDHPFHQVNNFSRSFAPYELNYVFFFLGLISRSEAFPETLENIKWNKVMIGILIGAAALWLTIMLQGLAYGYTLVAFVGSMPNAINCILVLATTPFQAYYEEYIFRHKLTEKIIEKYDYYIGGKNPDKNYKGLEKDSYIVYAISSVFFALAHIASPGRNYSILQCLTTTLPAGILYQKIYLDYGIEASTGLHAGHNILIMLNMIPVFIETAAYISPIHIMAVIFIALFAEMLLALIISHYMIPPIAVEEKPTESISLYSSVKLYCKDITENMTSYAKKLACCL